MAERKPDDDQLDDDQLDDDDGEGADDDDGGSGGADDAGAAGPVDAIRDVFEAGFSKLEEALRRKDEPVSSSSSNAGAGDVEAQVRNALAKVGREKETDDRLAVLEQRVPEKPPVKQSWLSRKIWGTVDA